MRKPPTSDGPARAARKPKRARARCPHCYRMVRVTRARAFERHDVEYWAPRSPGSNVFDPGVAECPSSRQPLSLEAEAGDAWANP